MTGAYRASIQGEIIFQAYFPRFLSIVYFSSVYFFQIYKPFSALFPIAKYNFWLVTTVTLSSLIPLVTSFSNVQKIIETGLIICLLSDWTGYNALYLSVIVLHWDFRSKNLVDLSMDVVTSRSPIGVNWQLVTVLVCRSFISCRCTCN